jgi:hypothetical protein
MGHRRKRKTYGDDDRTTHVPSGQLQCQEKASKLAWCQNLYLNEAGVDEDLPNMRVRWCMYMFSVSRSAHFGQRMCTDHCVHANNWNRIIDSRHHHIRASLMALTCSCRRKEPAVIQLTLKV